MYYRNRMYSVELGRFVGRDTEGYTDGLSLYGGYFVPGSMDPMGTEWLVYIGRSVVATFGDDECDDLQKFMKQYRANGAESVYVPHENYVRQERDIQARLTTPARAIMDWNQAKSDLLAAQGDNTVLAVLQKGLHQQGGVMPESMLVAGKAVVTAPVAVYSAAVAAPVLYDAAGYAAYVAQQKAAAMTGYLVAKVGATLTALGYTAMEYEVGLSPASVGSSYGKLGTVVKNPAAKITGFTGHGVDQAITRGVTTPTLLNTVRSPAVVLRQASGNRLFIGNDAAVVLNSTGKVVTTYPSSQFDATIRGILRAAK